MLDSIRKFSPNGQKMALGVLKFLRREHCVCGIKDLPAAARYLGSASTLEKQLLNQSDTLEKIVTDAYDIIKKTGVRRRIGTVFNRITNLQEPIQLVVPKIPKNIKNQEKMLISAYNLENQLIGMARVEPWLDNPLERALYIEFFSTNQHYKGIGTEMLRKIVQLSERLGLKGKVCLQASTGSIPSEFAAVCGGKFDTSCAIKYRKMGFEASIPSTTEKIDKAIKEGFNGFNDRKRDTLSCFMSLTPEAIKRYLSEKSVHFWG